MLKTKQNIESQKAFWWLLTWPRMVFQFDFSIRKSTTKTCSYSFHSFHSFISLQQTNDWTNEMSSHSKKNHNRIKELMRFLFVFSYKIFCFLHIRIFESVFFCTHFPFVHWNRKKKRNSRLKWFNVQVSEKNKNERTIFR